MKSISLTVRSAALIAGLAISAASVFAMSPLSPVPTPTKGNLAMSPLSPVPTPTKGNLAMSPLSPVPTPTKGKLV